MKCYYCEAQRDLSELEVRETIDELVCIDVEACDAESDKSFRAMLASYRKRLCEGDQLTDAEKRELADGS